MSTVWYFAYGSNMQSATFRGRRGIVPHRAHGARVVGWRVVFDKPPLIPIGESFANLVPDPAGEALGVLYEVDEADFDHIELTEGVKIGNYDRVEVSGTMLDEARVTVSAFTLTTTKSDPTLRPATRYMGLVIEGALEHGLPATYVDWLRSIPTCVPSEESIALRARIDEAMRLLRK